MILLLVPYLLLPLNFLYLLGFFDAILATDLGLAVPKI